MASLPIEQIQGFILRSYAMDSLRLFVLRVNSPGEGLGTTFTLKLPIVKDADQAKTGSTLKQK